MPLSSFHNRDMDESPFTIGEFVAYLSEFPQHHELRFMGMDGELFFSRFKQRGETLETIEFYEPAHDENQQAGVERIRRLEREIRRLKGE